MELYGGGGEILDATFRTVYFSSTSAKALGLTADEAKSFYGQSIIRRNIDGTEADVLRTSPESALAWARHNYPIMRGHLEPGEPEFRDVFGPVSEAAARVEPVATPGAWHDTVRYSRDLRFRRYLLGDVSQIQIRINDDNGQFIGVLHLQRSSLPEHVMSLLARGDAALFERMVRVSEPARRPAGVLFADLEASGALSRRLSSRGYFELIRDLTDLIDSSVLANSGIPGKHAGDGGSALFLVEDHGGSESTAARAAIQAGRAIRDGAAHLGPDDLDARLNVGLHWGATLMVGQVATGGRLEVTALGDQMNEGARIEAAARNGAILASKDLIERLDAEDAQTTGVDPDTIAYTPLAELDGASDKAIRDAGAIPVTQI